MLDQPSEHSAQDIVIELDLPGEYRYLSLVGTCICELLQAGTDTPVPEDAVYGIQLAVHEICNNIIEHAYGNETGRIALVLRLHAARRAFVADLFDSGKPYHAKAIEAPNPDEPREEGYGLFLVHQLMDEVHYDSDAGKNHWQVRKAY